MGGVVDLGGPADAVLVGVGGDHLADALDHAVPEVDVELDGLGVALGDGLQGEEFVMGVEAEVGD